MAQVVKNPPAVLETGVPSPGGEDLLKEGMAAHSSTLAGESHEWRRLVGTVHGVTKSQT